ncbi:class I SAM-dependent DNA methyltransferase [Conyzicola nivalis]|uniref:site-specific DNA-methyltransferase (adenine-specific) n=1 Tax=Conyzicola nivalis TaxID=1477021 RepID=A0A916SCG1_9MICO|nr:class I SAM-dependent DNA methyltransferase [Conyzicola nivalis]GGA93465.1 restriction endonuclease subunit M [Conyzicola nivalis]
MPNSDAFIVSEDWISESYFTSDATKQSYFARVIERRKGWEARKAELGNSPLTRFSAVRGEISSLIVAAADESTGDGSRADAAHDLTALLHRTLGFHDPGRAQRSSGPITWVRSTSVDTDVVALVDAMPADSLEDLLSKETGRLSEPWLDDDGKEIASVVARALSSIFADSESPDFAVVFAGRWTLVAERSRWAEGRYLAIDVQLVADRNEVKRGGEIDSALAALHSDSFIPEADGSVWWSLTLDDSIKHTVGVSQDLREGIRLSIEDIANEVVQRRATKGLEPLPDDQAQPLAIQSLRFLYRILFLLFAEASPELEVLPTNAADYDKGYSLDRLRELVQVKIESPKAKNGTHFYDSLAVLFRLVDQGHTPPKSDEEHDALTFNALRADLFSSSATSHIDEVGLGNEALQRVLDRLLLSKKQNNKQRGFISYAELGINQLGAVYEGLMSYTGFFASEPLYEVAPNGDSSKGSWVVPVAHVDAEAENAETWIDPHFVRREDEITQASAPVKHDRGEFVFRLAGRERQQSASYYTPEVLTRFTVSQALEELLDQDGVVTSAEAVLAITVCEPALGSGAFAIEAVRQLAEAYLKRRQNELGMRVDPEEYTRELQRVKAYIALHQVYGVDLNGTAVELAEISLWLDTMAPGLDAPWFGLHLRRGNSLIGARRAVYSAGQVADKSWLKAVPRDVALDEFDGIGAGIHHFLLPAEGWGATAGAKEGKELAPAAVTALKAWRRTVALKPSKKQVDELASISQRVEVLWGFARRRLEIADREVRRSIPVWGRDVETAGAVTREQIESSLADANGSYRRLRRIMDAWNALWFWPLTDAATGGVAPPTMQQWIDACRLIVGRTVEAKPAALRQGQASLSGGQSWTELDTEEQIELGYAGAVPIDDVLAKHPWLGVCEGVANQQGFFHWELDFAPVFERGGFDLQVGNPPWVRPDFDEAASLAESDVWWALVNKPPEEVARARRATVLAFDATRESYLSDVTSVVALRERVSAKTEYPHLAGLRPDLYRCFMEQTWRHVSPRGIVALIHPETHFTDEKAGRLRSATYRRLRRHWQFINEFSLFEIHHLVSYGIHVYGAESTTVDFAMATSIYHPSVVERSLLHDGSGQEPGLKDPDGNWDVRPHRNRIIRVTDETLVTWHAILEGVEVPVAQTRMVYAVNTDVASVLAKLVDAPRIANLGLEFSAGLIETQARAKRIIEHKWTRPTEWADVVLQGPHIHVANPAYKRPNPALLHNQDWSATDLEALGPEEIPSTSYKRVASLAVYRNAYGHSTSATGSSLDLTRLAWRGMAANTGERTLIPVILPPEVGHVNVVFSAGKAGLGVSSLIGALAGMSSLLGDFTIRISPKSNIYMSSAERVPMVDRQALLPALSLRLMRLNAVSAQYAQLWTDSWTSENLADKWTGGLQFDGRRELGLVNSVWGRDTPLRRASDRRQALLEIDALAAIAFGVTADELCTIYRTQFPVLYGYDHESHYYDVNGRLVPNPILSIWKKKGDLISDEERTATNQAGNSYEYKLPFVTLDREADMRQAYTHFETILKERT